MHDLLKNVEYCDQIIAYIKENIQAYLDPFDYDTTYATPMEPGLVYSQPIDVD